MKALTLLFLCMYIFSGSFAQVKSLASSMGTMTFTMVKGPHTIEMGSNQWNKRWVNSDGEVIYTDDVNYNPNVDQLLNRDDFKLTKTKSPN